jgi:hypothetical protein
MVLTERQLNRSRSNDCTQSGWFDFCVRALERRGARSLTVESPRLVPRTFSATRCKKKMAGRTELVSAEADKSAESWWAAHPG